METDTGKERLVREQDKKVTIYTDGACDPNPGQGGWAAILISGDSKRELKGAEADTTNNRMELRAVIEALRSLKHPCEVTVWSDSEYLCQGITQWLPKWQVSGWRTSGNRKVANRELWLQLTRAMRPHVVNWQWLRGHAGHPLNEMADRLARSAISSLPVPADDPNAAQVFTGASCNGPRGSGGWAALVREGGRKQMCSGRENLTTANRLHVLAVCQGLQAVVSANCVHVCTPSDYVQKGANLWMHGWQRMDWKTRGGQPVKNRDVWQSLAKVLADVEVIWHVPKGGMRPHESNQAWELANSEARR